METISHIFSGPHTAKVRDNEVAKVLASQHYNYLFYKLNGLFVRFGETPDVDPDFSPFGPEIADIEISKDGCTGVGTLNAPKLCQYCYKGNTASAPKNMTLAEYTLILDKLGPQLTQVALGITNESANPDFVAMLRETRARGIVPNYTTSGADLTTKMVDAIARYVGAVSVSFHGDADLTLNAVKTLRQAGVGQVNIHLVCTHYEAMSTFVDDVIAFTRENPDTLGALVFLWLKPKGRAKKLSAITQEQFEELVQRAVNNGVRVGGDSCSASRMEKIFPAQKDFIEPCESTRFSAYIDASGIFHPCSFAEGEPADTALDVIHCNDFLQDIWLHPSVQAFRDGLTAHGFVCPLFEGIALEG